MAVNSEPSSRYILVRTQNGSKDETEFTKEGFVEEMGFKMIFESIGPRVDVKSCSSFGIEFQAFDQKSRIREGPFTVRI